MAKPLKKLLIPALAALVLGGGGGAYYWLQSAGKATPHETKAAASKDTKSSGHGEKEATSAKSFMLNRTPVNVPIIEPDNKLYVSLTDLAPLLDGKLTKNNNAYTLQLTQTFTYTEKEGILQNEKFYIPFESVAKFGGLYYNMGEIQYIDYAVKRVERMGAYQDGHLSHTYSSRSAYEAAAKEMLTLSDVELLKKPAIVYYRYEELPKKGKLVHYGTYIPTQNEKTPFLLSVSAEAVFNKGKWKTTYHAAALKREMKEEPASIEGSWSNLSFTEELPQLPIDAIVKQLTQSNQKEKKSGH